MTFRRSLLAFLGVVVISVALAAALLVLLDPRSQAWWGARFSGLGTLVRSLVDTLAPR